MRCTIEYRGLFVLILLVNVLPANEPHSFPWTTTGDYPQWENCADLKDTDFRKEILVNKMVDPSINEPVKLAFAPDESGQVNLYFIERWGKVKYYHTADMTVSVYRGVMGRVGK